MHSAEENPSHLRNLQKRKENSDDPKKQAKAAKINVEKKKQNKLDVATGKSKHENEKKKSVALAENSKDDDKKEKVFDALAAKSKHGTKKKKKYHASVTKPKDDNEQKTVIDLSAARLEKKKREVKQLDASVKILENKKTEKKKQNLPAEKKKGNLTEKVGLDLTAVNKVRKELFRESELSNPKSEIASRTSSNVLCSSGVASMNIINTSLSCNTTFDVVKERPGSSTPIIDSNTKLNNALTRATDLSISNVSIIETVKTSC